MRELLDEGYALRLNGHVLGRENLPENKKVIIWSSFVRNVELIANRLQDLGAVFIHGGVDAGTEDEEYSREGKIREFKNNPNCMVMVANPLRLVRELASTRYV